MCPHITVDPLLQIIVGPLTKISLDEPIGMKPGTRVTSTKVNIIKL